MFDLGYEYTLIGAGDNQVISVRLPTESDHAEIVAQIRRAINEGFRSSGLIPKTEESFYSSALYCYQRKYTLFGRPVENGLKACRKAAAG